MFLQGFLSPANGFGIIQLRIVMLLNILLFVVSLVLFVNNICRYCGIEVSDRLIIVGVVIICIFGFYSWSEIFYWFSGAVSYSFPLSFCLLGIATFLQSKKKIEFILSAVLMFLASGGSLEVAGTGCFTLLSICLFEMMNKKINYKKYIVFFIAVAGALINATAPGNFVRHSVIDSSGLNLKVAIISTIAEVVCTIEELLFDKPFLIFIIIAGVVGRRIGRGEKLKINNKSLFMIILSAAIAPFVTCFPVALGYSAGNFPNRCKFVEIVVVVISFLIITLVVGSVFWNCLDFMYRREMLAVLAMFAIVMVNINQSWKLSQMTFFKMWELIGKDKYREYYNEVNDIYDSIAEDTNEDVFIYEKPDDISEFAVFNISEDMSDWINKSVASYYGKQSVQFVADTVYEQSDGEKIVRISPEILEGEKRYVSIFKVDDETQAVEILQVLQPLDKNMVLSIPKDEKGSVGIYAFEDAEGKLQIAEAKISY